MINPAGIEQNLPASVFEDLSDQAEIKVSPLKVTPSVQMAKLPVAKKLVSAEMMQTVRANVTVDDIVALDGVVNAKTGKAYQIDKTFFKNNWQKNWNTISQMDWVQRTAIIAYQHKMGLSEDGVIGKVTKQALEKQSSKSQTATTITPAKNVIAAGGGAPPDDPLGLGTGLTDNSLQASQNTFTGFNNPSIPVGQSSPSASLFEPAANKSNVTLPKPPPEVRVHRGFDLG